MIRLAIDQAHPEAQGGTRPSAPPKLLQVSWRIALVMGMAFSTVNDCVSKLTRDRPWLWSLSIVIGGAIAIGIDRLMLRLYMNYAPSIFDREA